MGNVVWEKAKRPNYKNQYIMWKGTKASIKYEAGLPFQSALGRQGKRNHGVRWMWVWESHVSLRWASPRESPAWWKCSSCTGWGELRNPRPHLHLRRDHNRPLVNICWINSWANEWINQLTNNPALPYLFHLNQYFQSVVPWAAAAAYPGNLSTRKGSLPKINRPTESAVWAGGGR